MRILITAAAGQPDPTRISIPLHIAVNGCVPEGQEVQVVLAGDATELAVGDNVERIEGAGIPSMRELVAKLIEHEIPVYVWKACAVARGSTDDDLGRLRAEWT